MKITSQVRDGQDVERFARFKEALGITGEARWFAYSERFELRLDERFYIPPDVPAKEAGNTDCAYS